MVCPFRLPLPPKPLISKLVSARATVGGEQANTSRRSSCIWRLCTRCRRASRPFFDLRASAAPFPGRRQSRPVFDEQVRRLRRRVRRRHGPGALGRSGREGKVARCARLNGIRWQVIYRYTHRGARYSVFGYTFQRLPALGGLERTAGSSRDFSQSATGARIGPEPATAVSPAFRIGFGLLPRYIFAAITSWLRISTT